MDDNNLTAADFEIGHDYDITYDGARGDRTITVECVDVDSNGSSADIYFAESRQTSRFLRVWLHNDGTTRYAILRSLNSKSPRGRSLGLINAVVDVGPSDAPIAPDYQTLITATEGDLLSFTNAEGDRVAATVLTDNWSRRYSASVLVEYCYDNVRETIRATPAGLKGVADLVAEGRKDNRVDNDLTDKARSFVADLREGEQVVINGTTYTVTENYRSEPTTKLVEGDRESEGWSDYDATLATDVIGVTFSESGLGTGFERLYSGDLLRSNREGFEVSA